MRIRKGCLHSTILSEVGGGVIPANSALVFELTLEGLEKPGLKIETLEGGDCSKDQRVRRKDNVTLHYTARLAADGIHPGFYSEVHTRGKHTLKHTLGWEYDILQTHSHGNSNYSSIVPWQGFFPVATRKE